MSPFPWGFAERLGLPTGLAVDAAGNIYIVESENQLIRMVDRNGMLSTIAGTGRLGFSGDGGPALSAQFRFATGLPAGLALDSSGNLLVADTGNGRIRIISAADRTVAGSGTADPPPAPHLVFPPVER